MDSWEFPAYTGIPWIASHAFAYPALEVLHIVGVALLLGKLLLLELRVWGVAPELPLQALATPSCALNICWWANWPTGCALHRRDGPALALM